MARASTSLPVLHDPTVRYARLKLGDTTYSLAFDFNALALAEEMTGLNLLQSFVSLGNLSASQTRGLLYAAILKRHPKVSLAQIGAAITFESLPKITEALGEAFRNAMPDIEETAGANPSEPDPEAGPADS